MLGHNKDTGSPGGAARRLSACRHPHCTGCDVRHAAICAAVGPELLPRLASIAVERSLAPRQLLFDEGDRAEHVFVVTGGMLKLYKALVDGRRQIVGFMVPSDFLGLAFGHLYIYSAETITIVTVCSIRRSQFLDFLDECPALEKEVLLRTCTELAAAQEQMLLLGRKSALERVASFILSMASRQRLHAGGTLELPMSRSDIADYLGLTIETVSRALGVMRRRALIAPKGPHRIAIPLPGQLEHFAGV
ncbi:MAG: helix-turn-helix domain-containing protein [Geminicoccaceae bacterium]